LNEYLSTGVNNMGCWVKQNINEYPFN